MLRTRLTDLFGLERPIVLAPLAGGATNGPLAAAVSEAGGLGLFGGIHPGGPEWIREQIRILRPRARGRWGVGFITWMLPSSEASFQTCLDEHVPIIALSFGDPTPYIALAKAAGAKVLCQVQSIESMRAALGAGADVVVAQGNEAGGHTGQLGTLPFLAQALEIAGDTPVLASGGIANGRALAAVLAAGAEGAWIGTPLLATHEAVGIADTYKKCIVESDGEDTVFTRAYDILYDMRFPDGIAGRARVNRFTREWHGRETELRQRREELAALVPSRPPLQRDPDIHPIWMGQSAGSVHGVRSVAEVIGGLCDETERLLRERSLALLGTTR